MIDADRRTQVDVMDWLSRNHPHHPRRAELMASGDRNLGVMGVQAICKATMSDHVTGAVGLLSRATLKSYLNVRRSLSSQLPGLIRARAFQSKTTYQPNSSCSDATVAKPRPPKPLLLTRGEGLAATVPAGVDAQPLPVDREARLLPRKQSFDPCSVAPRIEG